MNGEVNESSRDLLFVNKAEGVDGWLLLFRIYYKHGQTELSSHSEIIPHFFFQRYLKYAQTLKNRFYRF